MRAWPHIAVARMSPPATFYNHSLSLDFIDPRADTRGKAAQRVYFIAGWRSFKPFQLSSVPCHHGIWGITTVWVKLEVSLLHLPWLSICPQCTHICSFQLPTSDLECP